MFNEIIKNYNKKNPVRFHMPGHKGIRGIYSQHLNFEHDITELYFTDNLYNPDDTVGFTENFEKKISEIFFGKENSTNSCIISCGGATLLIQTVILYLSRRAGFSSQKFIICDRNSHISLINAVALCDIEPLWIFDEKGIEKILSENYGERKKIVLGIFVTSPDYYGKIWDIKNTAAIAHKHNIPLIADNSHGSHLAFFKDLHPMNNGADFSVDSMHKTLPVLTGGAVLHFSCSFFNTEKENLRSALRIFASTSPSFLTVQSIESAVLDLEETGRKKHKDLYNTICNFKKSVEALKIIPVRCGNHTESDFYDPFRIVLTTKNYDTTAEKLYFYLADNNIFCEFFDSENVIIIPSVANSTSDFYELGNELNSFFGKQKNAELKKQHSDDLNSEFRLPEKVMTAKECVLSRRKKVEVSQSVSQICAETIAVYPPGVPIIVCGEKIDAEIAAKISNVKSYIEIIDEEK